MLAKLRTLSDPDRVAVASKAEAKTFATLLRDVDALATKIPERAVVACLLDSGVDFTTVQLATMAAGACFFPLPPTAKPGEVHKAFQSVRPDVIVADRDVAPDARVPTCAPKDDWPTVRASEVLPEDTRILQLTSGSTGRPKGVVVGAQAIEASLAHSGSFLERFAGRAVFSPMPQFHAMGGAVVLEHLLHGATVLVSNRFVPGDDRRRMAEAEASLAIGSPSYFRMLLRLGMFRGDKLNALDAICLGSAPADGQLLTSLREALPRASIHIRYGLSETFGALTRFDLAAGEPEPPVGLVGPALGEVQVGPLSEPLEGSDPQEIRVRGDSVSKWIVTGDGELRPLRSEDDFFSTGDLGFLDDRGLHIRGRKSEFIKRLGFRIDPGEIEAALRNRAEIQEAVVVGVHDDLSGCSIVAVVEVAKRSPGSVEGVSEVDPAELADFCRGQLSDYKVPQRFELVAQIPRTPSGKPDRARIRETLTVGASADVD